MAYKDHKDHLAYCRKYDSEHHEEKLVRDRAYYAKNRARISAYKIAQYKASPEVSKVRAIKSRYGLSLDEYETILEKPCAICGDKATHLDHNHETGRVRGGLCGSCNLGLGLFKDNPDSLITAAGYVL